MMETPLSPTHFIERAGLIFGEREVVSARPEGVRRLKWREVAERVRRLAAGLMRVGVKPGDSVATLAWNHHLHLELYFAVPAVGAVLHTVNPRLDRGRIARIIAAGGAHLVFADSEFDELVPSIVSTIAPEELIAASEPVSELARFDERTACGLCHTSGTTGDPKGVLYSHRALALHAMAIALPDGFDLGERDVILPVVPMFHATAWGLPYAAAMTGAGLVLPGPRPTPRRVAELISSEEVTFAAGVPTVWMDVIRELRREPRPLSPRLRIHAGGAPSPPWLIEAFREELGVEVITGWGMTELSPVGAATHPRAHMDDWSDAELDPVRLSQGTPLPFVEAQTVADDGSPTPRDGRTPGELEVRGPWVVSAYLGREPGTDGDSFRDGWLRTGDVATIDADGFIRLVDRSKDLIRSGGEWISSVELENAIMAIPGVSEAAVVAMPHPRWQERPCAFVVPDAGLEGPVADEQVVSSVRDGLRAGFPKWWLPDLVELIDSIPRTATGKFDKRSLRAMVAGLHDDPRRRAGESPPQGDRHPSHASSLPPSDRHMSRCASQRE